MDEENESGADDEDDECGPPPRTTDDHRHRCDGEPQERPRRAPAQSIELRRDRPVAVAKRELRVPAANAIGDLDVTPLLVAAREDLVWVLEDARLDRIAWTPHESESRR